MTTPTATPGTPPSFAEQYALAQQQMGGGGLSTGAGIGIAGAAMGAGFLMQGISSLYGASKQAEVMREQITANQTIRALEIGLARDLSLDRMETAKELSEDRLEARRDQVNAEVKMAGFALDGQRVYNDSVVKMAFKNAEVALAKVVSDEKIGLKQVANDAAKIKNDRLAIMYGDGVSTDNFRS